MKCPKCGYVSFDHNQTCPKCKKDISLEIERLNLNSYRPDPPFLLGALIGEGGSPETTSPAGEKEEINLFEEKGGLSSERPETSGAVEMDLSGAEDLDINMSGSPEAESEISLEETDSLEDLSPEHSSMGEGSWSEESSADEDSELSELDLGSLELEELEESQPPGYEGGKDISSQADVSEGLKEKKSVPPESLATGEEAEDIDLGIPEEGEEAESEAEGSADLDELATIVEEIGEEGEEEEVVLDFEDLEKDET